MKIAVVGAGVSGLVAARSLQHQHQVTLFEAARSAGGHTNTLDLQLDGMRHPVDTGFIVFNETNYPSFTALLTELGIASQDSTMSFSFRSTQSDFEYMGASLDTLFAQRRNILRPSFYRMLRDILRFNREAPACLAAPGEMSLGQLLEENRYSTEFTERYLLPMGAAIWSAPVTRMRDFPARYFVQFFLNHGLLRIKDRPQWRTVTGGARRYVDAVLADFRGTLRLATPVSRIRRFPTHVQVTTLAHGHERFDAVVLACHSDQALALLADPSTAERAILGALPYQENDVVVHTDTRLLPRRRRAWAAWNYLARPGDDPVAVTYNLNILQRLPFRQQVLVTLNASDRVRPERIIARLRYAHPLYCAASVAAQARRGEISGVRHTHYCGAYWGHGFHEDGVASALDICEELTALRAAS